MLSSLKIAFENLGDFYLDGVLLYVGFFAE